MSGVWFLVGWVGLAVGVCAGVLACRAWSCFDRMGPGTRRARRAGCLCSRSRNLGGWREALVDSARLTRGCPVIAHHPDVRTRMYNPGK